MKRRRYTTEFKKEAAKMILIDRTPVKEVSQQLGVSEGVLCGWKQKQLAELEESAQSPMAIANSLNSCARSWPSKSG
jgi:transposase-like protein